MSNLDYRFSYRRNLPHIQPEGSSFFVTFRLKDSIPNNVLQQWKLEKEEARKLAAKMPDLAQVKQQLDTIEKQYFGKYDKFLDNPIDGPMWLKNPEIAQMVSDAIHFRDKQTYNLDAFCIMSNHAHIVFQPLTTEQGDTISLTKIMQSLKRFTAAEANKLLGRTGNPFWQPESYDRIIRSNGEWERIVSYVLNNPVKVGLVDSWEKWPWSYLKGE